MKNGSSTPESGARWHDKYPHLGTGPLSVVVDGYDMKRFVVQHN